jgi:hypothetical protein
MDNCKKAPQITSRFKVAPRTTKCTNMTLQTTKECKQMLILSKYSYNTIYTCHIFN